MEKDSVALIAILAVIIIIITFIIITARTDAKFEKLTIKAEAKAEADGEKWVLESNLGRAKAYVRINTKSGRILTTKEFDHTYETFKRKLFPSTSIQNAELFIEKSVIAGRVKMGKEYFPMCEVSSLEVIVVPTKDSNV